MFKRIVYISAGNANLIQSHEFWAKGENNPNETSITFSGQIESFVREIGAEALMLSTNADGRTFEGDGFTIEHRPAPPQRSGVRYYLDELKRVRAMVKRARAFGADLAIIDSGAMPYFMMQLFAWAGMPVVMVLHNTLWPRGFRSNKGLRAIVEKLDAGFVRRGASAIIAVSPEAARQVDELAPGHTCPVVEIRAQFEPDYFAAIPPAPPWDSPTFNMMFIGRVQRAKGVLDFPAMAKRIEAALPGRVKWTVCGRGLDLDELKRMTAAEGLEDVIDVRGWTSLEDLADVYARTHASIVPTRSLFAEGLAMTAVEAILAGRPVVTNPVVPAHEVLAPAVILGRTNDPDSHADAIVKLASDRALYEQLRDATVGLRAPFYDRSQGLTAVLHKVVNAIEAGR